MAKKKKPKILSLPMWHSLALTWVAEFPRPWDELKPEEQAAYAKFQEQMRERKQAVYEYFEIDPAEPDAKDKLILAMCRELFPVGFSSPLGNPKNSNAGNARKWTFERKLALVEFVSAFKSKSRKRKEAFKAFAAKNGMTAESVEQRFYDAIRMLNADFKSLDPADQLEALRRHVGLPTTEIK